MSVFEAGKGEVSFACFLEDAIEVCVCVCDFLLLLCSVHKDSVIFSLSCASVHVCARI